MIMRFVLNALSAHWQFEDSQRLNHNLEELLSCFEHLAAGLEAGTILLIYDPCIEARGLMDGGGVLQSCLRRAKQNLRLRWFYYTKNVAKRAGNECRDAALSAGGETLAGLASRDLLDADLLIGLGGSPACDSDEVTVQDVSINEGRSIRSVSRLNQLRLLVPRYERNEKHGFRPYIRAGGEEVAPMTVSDADAQKALLAALRTNVEEDSPRFGVFKGKFLKFVYTGDIGGAVFHAYEVEALEVPDDVLEMLRARVG